MAETTGTTPSLPRCHRPMRGVYGAETICARPRGHAREHGWQGHPDGCHPINSGDEQADENPPSGGELDG